ncbi:FHA domain-containing protein [Desulfocapsa sulfexigens DSM 10523]|uniref:FHA domain-containing protein n=1 Tax=Desulfocapsa sulfexigens (strain DSM 10523 / SB164P1) TaxID=1167006 RepID=M1NI12_DESSD|nr:FHA domain-containing protein [Desulfocapsa sulfexigens]AGF79229.1 FHA domain-containing protein [Desulfocapsa sulfexigens DSM 10523]
MIQRLENNGQNSSPPAVLVSATWPAGQFAERAFSSSFRVGRDPDCDIAITDPVVSRHHAEVIFLADTWWIQDCNSANGIFVDGNRVNRIAIKKLTRIELGRNGPLLTLSVDQPFQETKKPGTPRSMSHYQEHYFGDKDDGDAGEHTIMVRRAFAQVQKKQKRKYGIIIGLVTCLFCIAGSVAIYMHLQVEKQKKLAAEIFYTMKGLEVEFADVLQTARDSDDTATIARVEYYKQQARELENSYSEFVDTLGIYKNISPQEEAILKTARIFGECEIFVPADFTSEVIRYIKKWQSSSRLVNALERAENNGYTSPIARTMRYYFLPPQFFYLALQESNFNVNALGPKTRWGIAKGMWQFIPETGSRYGLQTGPLFKQRKVDPLDERHNFAKSTVAAAKYLRKIYDTDAQASGLLVMASYNWGENRVIQLVRDMPNNPKERNFWQFFKQYRDKIPEQTYDYVFYIFSAAVIGENPGLFGFDFDNPLIIAAK